MPNSRSTPSSAASRSVSNKPIARAVAHLKGADPVLAGIIERVGPVETVPLAGLLVFVAEPGDWVI
jgi:hypothetical protein